MSKIVNTIKILNLLEENSINGKLTQKKDLSSLTNLTDRSIREYIKELSKSGIPLISKSGVNGGIIIDKSYFLDKLKKWGLD